ncbi:hypothetical protein M3661_19890 [Paenibacillus sp. MER 180]|uniref:hypothetical protein n=1 Tax=Paenibacillus sp. MER 180 TaxID=2939570 RepID=UPI002040F050|nr:hypothetical protein [Paenibacillus sp. MER 180]MCM3292386.1 hypothetical protein [Paenibacillus sp. MER 180]
MKRKNLIWVVIGIISIWALSAVIITLFVDETYRGTAGDMFGAVNSLFAGLAFAGIIYTISIQRQELKEQQKAIQMQTEELSLQRKAIEMQTQELKMQREETARSADQLESQRNLMNLQIAMTTINELIMTKNKRIERIVRTSNGDISRGIQALVEIVRSKIKKNEPITKDEQLFHNFCNSFIYILQYITNSDLNSEQKQVLGKMLDMDSADVEIYIIYSAFEADQHVLALLKQFGFDARYKRISSQLI